jgi:hypothetical protein
MTKDLKQTNQLSFAGDKLVQPITETDDYWLMSGVKMLLPVEECGNGTAN